MRYKVFIFLITFISTSVSYANKVIVGNFSNTGLANWSEKKFKGHTNYSLTQAGTLSVLASSSSNSASGLLKKTDINLNKPPIINWSWKIKNTIESTNERAKSGDDYAARIYIVFSDGPFFWQTKTLNYVWANQATAGEHWPNPYTGNAQMLAIRAGGEKTDIWRTESRNVLEDIQKVFGKTVTNIEAIAIMTDTDQTGSVARAWFGDIWFSDQ